MNAQTKISNMINWINGIFFSILSLTSCAEHKSQTMDITADDRIMQNTNYDTAYFGTGCFWCTEAIFQRLKGVVKVNSGYSGGNVPSPTYEEVCTGTTGHAEA